MCTQFLQHIDASQNVKIIRFRVVSSAADTVAAYLREAGVTVEIEVPTGPAGNIVRANVITDRESRRACIRLCPLNSAIVLQSRPSTGNASIQLSDVRKSVRAVPTIAAFALFSQPNRLAPYF